jgi:hypothetical protein
MKTLGALLCVAAIVAYVLVWWTIPSGLGFVLAAGLCIALMKGSEACADHRSPETPEAEEYRRIREEARRREATGRPDWS